jgi:hypothetical protein
MARPLMKTLAKNRSPAVLEASAASRSGMRSRPGLYGKYP